MSANAPGPAAATQGGYQVRTGDVNRDREAVLGVWQGNLGDERLIAGKYDWFYRDAPAGAPLLQLLLHDGAAIGVAAAGPRRMHWPGRGEVLAGVLVDLAVTPEHRSLGPALMLQQGIARAGLERFDLLYGFPNPKSAAVFKRMGYRHVGDLQRLARALRHARYLRERLPAPLATAAGMLLDALDGLRLRLHAGRLGARWSDALPQAAIALCEQHPLLDALAGIRDRSQLQWRLDESPLERLRHLLVHQPGADTPLAWFAVRIDGDVMRVIDHWSREPAQGMPSACIATLLREARKQGVQSVSMEIADTPLRLRGWHARGFRLRQARPVFMARPVASEGEPFPDLHLTAADEDQ